MRFSYIFKILCIAITFVLHANSYANEAFKIEPQSINALSLANLDNQIFSEPWLSLQALTKLETEFEGRFDFANHNPSTKVHHLVAELFGLEELLKKEDEDKAIG